LSDCEDYKYSYKVCSELTLHHFNHLQEEHMAKKKAAKKATKKKATKKKAAKKR
jgi:hypothetical protein